MTNPEPPGVYVSECGCVHTTEGEIIAIGMFEKRIRTVVKTTFCAAHRQKYQGAGSHDQTSYLISCKLCRFYFCMAMIALGGWIWAAVELAYVLPSH